MDIDLLVEAGEAAPFLQELAAVFDQLEPELMLMLIDSVGCRITDELVGELCNLQPVQHTIVRVTDDGLPGLPERMPSGCALIFIPDNSEPHPRPTITVHSAHGLGIDVRCACLLRTFGPHMFELTTPAGAVIETVTTLVETPLYAYARAVDDMFDALYWSWTGEWTGDLEAATLELCVAVDEHLASGSSFATFVSAVAREELDAVREDLRSSLALTLDKQDPQAIGRLHMGLGQFLEPGAIMSTPELRARSEQ